VLNREAAGTVFYVFSMTGLGVNPTPPPLNMETLSLSHIWELKREKIHVISKLW
jgi:hypothetical protein